MCKSYLIFYQGCARDGVLRPGCTPMLPQAREYVDSKGLHVCHRRKNGQLCNRKWSVELFMFTEEFCSDECEALHRPNKTVLEGKDRLVYSTVKRQADIQRGYLGDLASDRLRMHWLYERLLAYANHVLGGGDDEPPFPIAQFPPAMIVALFLKSQRAETLGRKFLELSTFELKIILTCAMAATNITEPKLRTTSVTTWLKANYNISPAEETDWADLRRKPTPNPPPQILKLHQSNLLNIVDATIGELKAYEKIRSPEYKSVFLRWSYFEKRLAWIKGGRRGHPPKPDIDSGSKKHMPFPIETRNGALKSEEESESDSADENHSTTSPAKQKDLKRKQRDSPAVGGSSTTALGAPARLQSTADNQEIEGEEIPSSSIPVEPVIGHMLNALMNQNEAHNTANHQLGIQGTNESDLAIVESLSDTSIGRPKKKRTSGPPKK